VRSNARPDETTQTLLRTPSGLVRYANGDPTYGDRRSTFAAAGEGMTTHCGEAISENSRILI
jgi:hypothetical protein